MVRSLAFMGWSFIVACGTQPASTSNPPESRRGGIGVPCRHGGDCIEGAGCNNYTCDFVAPCATTSIASDDTRRARTYHFDAAGRQLGWSESTDGEPTARQRWTWSSDHRRVFIETWFDEPDASPSSVETVYFDAHGKRIRMRQEGDSNMRFVDYHWDDTWTCRAPRIKSREVGGHFTSRPTCDADGAPSRIEFWSETGLESWFTFEFEGGYLKVHTTHYVSGTPVRTAQSVFTRDARGAVVATTWAADGTIYSTDTYDLSCWVVEADRVRYVGHAR